MKVGLYFDLRNPPAWAADPHRLYGFTLEMCEEADRLGCHSIWLSEHHLFDDGYLPQTLTMAAAIAARTHATRIGTAVLLAPLHKPVEIAEQAAIVDLISGGRLDLGLGTGYRQPEFALYGESTERRYTKTDTTARELRQLWEGVITPRPVQPLLPIWMGYQGPKGAARAGRLGEGLLSANPAQWPPYRDALIAAGHDPASGRMAGGVTGWITDDPERDWKVVSRHVAAQFDSYRVHMVEGTGAPLPRPIDPGRIREQPMFKSTLGSLTYGTPASVAAEIRAATAGAPVETVFIWASIAGMPEEMVAEHVDIICTQLAPLLADHEPVGATAELWTSNSLEK